jgi:predicted nucleic acid-binding protein
MRAVTESGGHVPAHFMFEVVHGLQRLKRRGIMRRPHVDEFVAKLAEMPLTIDAAYGAADITALYEMARGLVLNIYDAAYVELAQRTGHPLATRDTALAVAAIKSGVALFKP